MGVTEFVMATCLIGLVAAALTDRSPGGSRLAKMTASSLVLLVALTDQSGSTYAGLVVLALAASWVGDLALSYSSDRAFLVGLISFALGHVFYVLAFIARGSFSLPWLLGGALLMAVVGVLVLRWLRPHRPQRMATPLVAYVSIIGVMVACAFATHGGDTDWRIPVAAMAFAASDILVARQQFVAHELVNRLVGLPLYFFAQALFAITATAIGPVAIA